MDNRQCGGLATAGRTRGIAMRTVLVVDDEFGIVELIADVLTDEGHQVVTASHGRQGTRDAGERATLALCPELHDACAGRWGMLRGMAEARCSTAFRSC